MGLGVDGCLWSAYMNLSNAVIELVFGVELGLDVVSLQVPWYFIGIVKFLKILVKVLYIEI